MGVFKKEVSGMDHKMIGAYYASVFSNLSAEAAANVNSNHSSKLKHIGETTLPARAATPKRKCLEEEASLVNTLILAGFRHHNLICLHSYFISCFLLCN